MAVTEWLRSRIKAARKRGSAWVRFLDIARLLANAQGRGQLLTRILHGRQTHQTTPQTAPNRYPELFDLAASLAPDAVRVLSFGCSTGEELVALRHRFTDAEIVGAEINPRSRKLARGLVHTDPHTTVVPSKALAGTFDLIFALAVLQREPHKIAEMGVEDLSPFYPFARFDDLVTQLVGMLREGGLLCVINAQYRVEDSSAAKELQPLLDSPAMDPIIFGPDGRRLEKPVARTIFRKVGASA